MNPEDGPASLCALASVRQPTGPKQNSHNNILNKTDCFYSLWNVPPRVAHFVTGLSRFRGEEPPKRIMENDMKKTPGREKGHNMISPWPTSHHLVVIVGPQVGLLTGSGVD